MVVPVSALPKSAPKICIASVNVKQNFLRGGDKMKLNYSCLPCLVNQVVKVAEMTNAADREGLFGKVFRFLSNLSFTETNPEIIGEIFDLLKQHTGNDDPYSETRIFYNRLFMSMMDDFTRRISRETDVFSETVKYAILGNIIDFNPIHNSSMEDIMAWFDNAATANLTINHTEKLKSSIESGSRLLYLGDNCGEICLDMLLIKEIKRLNPLIEIYFGVRGKAIVNDSIEEDAYFVGMDKYAKIISNGDGSMGTVLSRCSEEFKNAYNEADIVIAKGQANYESLFEDRKKNIFFLLVTKCDVISKYIGVPEKSLICSCF